MPFGFLINSHQQLVVRAFDATRNELFLSRLSIEKLDLSSSDKLRMVTAIENYNRLSMGLVRLLNKEACLQKSGFDEEVLELARQEDLRQVFEHFEPIFKGANTAKAHADNVRHVMKYGWDRKDAKVWKQAMLSGKKPTKADLFLFWRDYHTLCMATDFLLQRHVRVVDAVNSFKVGLSPEAKAKVRFNFESSTMWGMSQLEIAKELSYREALKRILVSVNLSRMFGETRGLDEQLRLLRMTFPERHNEDFATLIKYFTDVDINPALLKEMRCKPVREDEIPSEEVVDPRYKGDPRYKDEGGRFGGPPKIRKGLEAVYAQLYIDNHPRTIESGVTDILNAIGTKEFSTLLRRRVAKEQGAAILGLRSPKEFENAEVVMDYERAEAHSSAFHLIFGNVIIDVMEDRIEMSPPARSDLETAYLKLHFESPEKIIGDYLRNSQKDLSLFGSNLPRILLEYHVDSEAAASDPIDVWKQ